MQFLGTAPKPSITTGQGNEHSTRHTILSLYAELPSEDITLEEFERLALERLRGK